MQKVEPKNQGCEFLWVRGYSSISIFNSVRTLFCTFWVSVFIGDPSDSSKTTKISAVGKPQNSMPLLCFCGLGLVGLKIFIIWSYTSWNFLILKCERSRPCVEDVVSIFHFLPWCKKLSKKIKAVNFYGFGVIVLFPFLILPEPFSAPSEFLFLSVILRIPPKQRNSARLENLKIQGRCCSFVF